MSKPTAEDMARNLAKDLATCRAASKGPWRSLDDLVMTTDHEGCFAHVVADLSNCDDRGNNIDFIIAAREGWPIAIRRGLHALALLAELVPAMWEYMSAVGQGYAAHGLPFGPQQAAADARVREALARAEAQP